MQNTRPLLTEKLKLNTVWISDIHLGHKDCKANYLLDFLERIECQTLYLVGDIIDIWSLTRSFYWPSEHNQVIRAIMKIARDGTRVIYIPGNHDRLFREYAGEKFGNIEVHLQYLHTTATGKNLLVMHGDELDDVMRLSRFHRLIGDRAYDLLLFMSRLSYKLRQKFGYTYWSLAGYIKSRLSNAAQAIHCYETAAMEWAASQSADGIICGHIHHPELRIENGLLYCNDGDWIENCTALVETRNGHLAILHWSDLQHCMKAMPQPHPTPRKAA